MTGETSSNSVEQDAERESVRVHHRARVVLAA